MKLHFLKTQWSDIIILEENGHYAMVDTGFEEQFPMIRDYLQDLGVAQLDFILLTHFHRDHYGSIPALLTAFDVKRVYLKEYSGLDCTTAWGTTADDEYRQSEMDKFVAMQQLIREKSELVPVELLSSIFFCDHEMKLYSAENSIREIYEDTSHPDTYHQICCSENQNSLAVWMTVEGKNIFLGGDILDHPSAHPRAAFVNRQIAEQIQTPMDIYKVPHHATINTGLPETLAIYRPRIAVITNEENYLTTSSDALDNLRAANPDVRILLTEKNHVVLSVPEDVQ